MDAIKKKHFDFLLAALAICCFIVMDVYIISPKSKQEVITDRDEIIVSQGRHYDDLYKDYIITNNGRYLLPIQVFQHLKIGDTVIVNRSVITNALKSITYLVKGKMQTANINSMDISGSMFFVFVTIGGILLFMVFYNRVAYLPGRSGLTVFFCIGTAVVLVAYIALNIFYIDL